MKQTNKIVKAAARECAATSWALAKPDARGEMISRSISLEALDIAHTALPRPADLHLLAERLGRDATQDERRAFFDAYRKSLYTIITGFACAILDARIAAERAFAVDGADAVIRPLEDAPFVPLAKMLGRPPSAEMRLLYASAFMDEIATLTAGAEVTQ